jgi:hypothetical protein
MQNRKYSVVPIDKKSHWEPLKVRFLILNHPLKRSRCQALIHLLPRDLGSHNPYGEVSGRQPLGAEVLTAVFTLVTTPPIGSTASPPISP